MPIAPPALESAPSPNERGYLSLALRGGYGALLAETDNYLAGRIGGSVGYTFAGSARFTLGVDVLYQTGFSAETSTIAPPVTRGSSGVYAGGTIGLGIGGDTVVVRPFALVGAHFATRVCVNCYATPAERSETYPVVGVGLGLHFLTSVVFFGVEGRAMAVVREGSTNAAAVVDGVLGVRFR